MLSTYKKDNPHITKAYIWLDGAGNLHNAGLLAIFADSEEHTGALGMPDVTLLPAQAPTLPTARSGKGQNRNHGRLPTSTASAARRTPLMSAYDEIQAIEAAARRET